MIEPLTVNCPKCGYINNASAMNCEACHINLDWAQANRESFEADKKPKQQMGLHDDPTAPGMQKSLSLQQKLGLIIVIVAFTLNFMVFAGSDWLFCLLGLLVFAGWIWLGGVYEGKQETELEKTWLELARETRLTYIPGKRSFLSTSYPKLQGEYQGVPLSMEYVVEGGGEYDGPVGYTIFKLRVRNPSRFSLEVNSNWIFMRKFRKHAVLSGNHEFDRHFRVKGTPQIFVHRAIRLADLQELLLSDEWESKIMKNPAAFSWSSYCRPSIKLDASDLICKVHGVYELVNTQTDMLNGLCELAGLVEQMGREQASSFQAGNRMERKKTNYSSIEQQANRQALACIAFAALTVCALTVISGLLVWSLIPQVYPVIETQVALLSPATFTPHPTRPAVTAGPTSTPLAGYIHHRIGVRTVNGVGEFYDRLTGEKFIPRGYNYARFSPIFGTTGQPWEETLGPGFYNPEAAEDTLQQMHANGYNIVRVAIDCCRPSSNIGSKSGGISSAYIGNVLDFLNKAKANDIYVIFALNLTPADGDFNRFWNNDPKIFDAANLRYLAAGGFQSKRLYDQDFVRALIKRNAPLDAVLAYDLTDSVGYDANWPPLTLQSGMVSTVNGKTYDMASPDEKQNMLNENLVYWVDQQRAAILEVDPTALVTASFHALTAKSTSAATYANAVIWESTADFIDLHIYMGSGLTLEDYVNNFGMHGMTEKPIIMGQFLAWRTSFSSSESAARTLENWQVASCQFGFDGWVLWNPSQENPDGEWSGPWDENIIDERLAPVNRPDPCKR